MGGRRELGRRFDPALLRLLEKLNRADLGHLGRLESLVVPEEPLADELKYSPLPVKSSWATVYPKAIIVDQPSQTFGAYEHGVMVRWGPISSGSNGAPTPSGLFHLNWRSIARTSTKNAQYIMHSYFNFYSARGLAFHQFDLPGLPASHGCIRLLERDARWLYVWGEEWVLDEKARHVVKEGTPVLIVGQYDFASPPPWVQLAWLARGVYLPAAVSIKAGCAPSPAPLPPLGAVRELKPASQRPED